MKLVLSLMSVLTLSSAAFAAEQRVLPTCVGSNPSPGVPRGGVAPLCIDPQPGLVSLMCTPMDSTFTDVMQLIATSTIDSTGARSIVVDIDILDNNGTSAPGVYHIQRSATGLLSADAVALAFEDGSLTSVDATPAYVQTLLVLEGHDNAELKCTVNALPTNFGGSSK